MPNYDYKCPSCGCEFEAFAKIAERHFVRCACGSATQLQPGAQRPIAFKEGFYEHLGKDPIYVSSKRQLKDECKKRDLFSPYAWD